MCGVSSPPLFCFTPIQPFRGQFQAHLLQGTLMVPSILISPFSKLLWHYCLHIIWRCNDSAYSLLLEFPSSPVPHPARLHEALFLASCSSTMTPLLCPPIFTLCIYMFLQSSVSGHVFNLPEIF